MIIMYLLKRIYNVYLVNNYFISTMLFCGTLPLPRTPVMYAIISLHDHILFIMCIILTIVIYLLINTLVEYIYTFDNIIPIQFDVMNTDELTNYINQKNIYKLYKWIWFYLPFDIKKLILKVIIWYQDKMVNLKEKFYRIFPIYSIKTNIYNIRLCDQIKESVWSKKEYSWLLLSHCTMLEIYWTLLPCILLTLIAIPSFWLLYAFDEIMDPSVTFKIIGHQWYWSYEMSDFNGIGYTWPWAKFSKHPKIKYDSYLVDITELKSGDFRLLKTTYPLLLPKDLHIRLLVTSDDVLHSFSVPAFGIKIDAVPGRLNQLSIFIKDYGIFFGQCSELCGANHGFMPIEIFVIPMRQFYWILYDSILFHKKWWWFEQVKNNWTQEQLEKIASAFESDFKPVISEKFSEEYINWRKKKEQEYTKDSLGGWTQELLDKIGSVFEERGTRKIKVKDWTQEQLKEVNNVLESDLRVTVNEININSRWKI